MRLTSIALFTFVLLSCVVGMGYYGFSWGSELGQQALAGITQLEVGLKRRPIRRRDESLPRGTVVFLSETEILQNLKAQLGGAAQSTPGETSSTPVKINQAGFPITATDQGVVLEVRSSREEGGLLLLDTYLRNDGEQAVRFLYSLLDVTDHQGQILSATVEGLPRELAPLSQELAGTIRIPTAVLTGVEHLSIALTDYPEQQINLVLPQIPIN
jgi:hypothetical protein